MSVKEIERPLSLSELVTERLRESIIYGDLKLGESVSEIKLGKSLGVSKTPVRHALAQLKLEGLVTVIPQKGTYIFTLSYSDLEHLNEHRAIIERNALRFSFGRNRTPLCKKLGACVAKMSKSRKEKDQRKYLRLDSEFHDIILMLADNPYLYDSYKIISAKIAALRTHLSTRPLQTERSYKEHQQILKALTNGDVDQAVEVLDHHIGRYKRSYDQETPDIAAVDKKRS